MLKKYILNISIVSLVVILLASCSRSSNSIIEEKEQLIIEKEQVIEELGKKVEEADVLLADAMDKKEELMVDLEVTKDLVDEAVFEIDELKLQNDELVLSLEDSQAMLLELESEEDLIYTAISPYSGMSVLVAATNVLEAMRTDDYVTLASYVDLIDGVYVSPYQYIDFSYIINLTQDNILNMATLPTVFPWGYEPASGDLISLTLIDYFNEYMYDEDYYIAPVVGMNNVVSSGNMINNIVASFPTTDTVEFLFPEFDPSFGGLDWSSITLIFNTDSGIPMLLGVIHGQWTP